MKFLRTPLRAMLFVSSACAITILVFNACRKMSEKSELYKVDANEIRFFNVKPGTDTIVQSIASNIRRQHKQRGVIETLIKNAGFPIWEKSRISSKDVEDGKQIFIPFSKDGRDQVTALLLVRLMGNDTLFRMLYAGHYDDYGFAEADRKGGWSAKDVWYMFAVFDNDVFGVNEYYVSDGRLLNREALMAQPARVRIEKTDPPSTGPNGRQQTVWEITQWVLHIVCGSCDQPARQMTVGPCCNATYDYYEVTFWYDDEEDEWGWFPDPALPGDPGGAGPCPGCNWEQTNPCDVEPPYEDLCDPYWQPVMLNQYNPLAYDSISVDDELIDSNFQCLYDILTNDLNDINKKTQLLLYTIFDVPLYNHVHFKMDWTAGASTDWNMETNPGVRTWIDDNMHFYDTIRINPYFARTMTKEMIIASAIHETVHAYINWCKVSYQNSTNGVDSLYLKEHFPAHWAGWFNFAVTPQHEIMITQYVDEIVRAVVAGGNQNAPQSLRELIGKSLAYCGLDETSVWRTLPDTCLYKGVGAWAQVYDKPSSWSYTPSGCGSFNRSFRDSLQMLGPCQ